MPSVCGPSRRGRLSQVVSEVVGHRQTLVVVDNCEHVVEAAAALVDELLQGAPGLRVLATSRDPLRIAGEAVWRVAPLDVPHPGADAERPGVPAPSNCSSTALSRRAPPSFGRSRRHHGRRSLPATWTGYRWPLSWGRRG